MALWNARFSDGIVSNRNPLRDVSTRLEEKYYGARGDALLSGQNVEITQRLSLARRPGLSVYNSQIFDSPDRFYEFRLFNANEEQIKVIIDDVNAIYNGTGPSTKIAFWDKANSGESYFQSVGNSLYFGDGYNQKKWVNTLQVRIPFSGTAPIGYNPYNFTPFELNTFIIDNNGNAEQLIGAFITLSSLYISQNTLVFSLNTTGTAPASAILTPGLQLFFPPSSQVATILGQATGVTLTVQQIVGGVKSISVSNGGTGYTTGDVITVNQVSQTGSQGATATVTAVGGVVTALTLGAHGTGYLTADNVPTTGGTGTDLTVNIVSDDTQFSAAYNYSGGPITSGSIDSGGSGYTVGDTLVPQEPSQGTSSGAAFTVSTVSGGVVTGVTLTSGGIGYVTSTGLATTTSGSGTGATLDIVVANPSSLPPTSVTDVVTIFSGGIPISNSTSNAAFVWPTSVGAITYDGSAVWVNRGQAIDNGLVWNWGIAGGSTAPSIQVNNAISSWTPDTYYNQFQIILDTTGTPNVQMLIVGGTSGGSSPTWNTVLGGTTVDGEVKWLCVQLNSTLTWAAGQAYQAGQIIEATTAGTPCLFQLQSAAGIQFQGSNFPAYVWQTASQSGDQIGSAGQWYNGSSNAPMTYPQPLPATSGTPGTAGATLAGTMSGLFGLVEHASSTNLMTAGVSGNGTTGGLSTFFASSQFLNLGMFPTLVIPYAGSFTFKIGHENMFFWGIGAGKLSIDITGVSISGGILTATSNRNLDSLLTPGVQLTFENMLNSLFLNGVTVTVSSTSAKTFTASYSHADYAFKSDSGKAVSNATLTPTVVSVTSTTTSGAVGTWNGSYNFSSGTPVKHYPIMSSSFNTVDGNAFIQDTVVLSFPSAGVYPAEAHYGFWDGHIDSYTLPTVSPALPGGANYSFYMVYSPPGSSVNYNIIPQALAQSGTTAPVWPAWTTTNHFNWPSNTAYPFILDTSGNQLWWNIGPVSTFQWNASVNYTTENYIVDANSNKEVPFEAGVSGTILPNFSTTPYDITADLPNLVWINIGPAGNSPTGTVSTFQGGWTYVVALVNTLDDTVSNASIASATTGNFFSATGVLVSGGLPENIDPQADYVAVFRTDDGGATYFLVPGPSTGNGNTEYTLPLSQYLAQGFLDTTLDSGLNFLLQAPIAKQNTPPPVGLINLCYNVSRIFGSVGNTIYWSTGPDTPIGNGINGFAPNNFAEFPSLVKRLVPLNIGLVVFTVSDIYILTGNGTASAPFTPYPYLQRTGLLSYNALTICGSIIYFMTTDNQVVSLDVHAGLSEVGHPIADLLDKISPLDCYLTWHINGSFDQALFVGDGSTGWYRMLPTPAPETGETWCPKANIVGGCKAVQSVETTPGNIQLLVGPKESGPILYRDYNTYADNGELYPADFILGSLVLAQPGQLAMVDFITADSIKTGTALSIGVLIGEISGDFENLSDPTLDPPNLPAAKTLYNLRFWLSQTLEPAVCRHMQIQVSWPAENYASEILSLSPVGSFSNE